MFDDASGNEMNLLLEEVVACKLLTVEIDTDWRIRQGCDVAKEIFARDIVWNFGKLANFAFVIIYTPVGFLLPYKFASSVLELKAYLYLLSSFKFSIIIFKRTKNIPEGIFFVV